MGQPIPLHIAPRDPQHELDVQLQQAPMEHAEALLSAYELLQVMHDKGVLEVMRGTFGGGEKVLDQVVTMAKSPESIRALRNLLILVKTLGDIDPDRLRDVTQAMPKAPIESEARDSRPPGLFKLLGNLRNKDFRRGLAAGAEFLTIFGRNLGAKPPAA